MIDMTGWNMWEPHEVNGRIYCTPDSRWTVIERDDDIISDNGSKIITYKCQCNCEKHTIKTVRGYTLRLGISKSCGCIKSEKFNSEETKRLLREAAERLRNNTGRVIPRIDIIGKKFGMLTVREQTDDVVRPNGAHFAQYICDCDCGNTCIVPGSDLTKGISKGHTPKTHCGCQTFKNMSLAQIKGNVYSKRFDENGAEYVVGIANNTGEEFYLDTDDFDLVQNYTWFVHIDQTGYKSLMSKVRGSDKHIKMTALFGCKYFDHQDRNPLNNRRNNLKLKSDSEQMLNRNKRKDNKSGIVGVRQVKNDNDKKQPKTWYAELKINKQRVLSRFFETEEEAIIARLNAEAQYVPDNPPQKHLFEKYDIKINTQQNN